MNIVESIIAVIAPHACIGCRNEGSLLCYDCQKALPAYLARCYRCGRTDQGDKICKACRSSSGLYRLAVATDYEANAKALLWGLKAERKKAAAEVIAQAMALHFPFADVKDVMLTHIPTAPRRARIRGYDQAACIARALAKQLQLPYSPLLARTGQQRQVGERRMVRLQQMQRAFRPIRLEQLENKHIVLIDDVITTGATLESAARTLKAAGAKRISAAVFAAA